MNNENKTPLVDIARKISCYVWEKAIIDLLWCSKYPTEKWADLRLDDDTDIEVKSRLYGQPVNILIKQLLELRYEDIYALVYYKMYNKLRPVETLQSTPPWILPYDFLQSQMKISKIFLFPASDMRDFYFLSQVREATIKPSWLKHKWLSVTPALEMFEQIEDQKLVFESSLSSERVFKTQIYSIWEKMIQILKERGHQEL